MTTLALCMIVKDEEKNIERCIKSVKPIVDDIIVIDTGSKDKTKGIAKKLGARVFDAMWKDDFSKARNEYLKHVKSDWVLVLDADETISESDHKKIREMIEKAGDIKAYALVQRNYMDENSSTRFKLRGKDTYKESEGIRGWDESRLVRLFKFHPGLSYSRKVHETLVPSIKMLGGRIVESSMPLHHYGKLSDTSSKGKVYEKLGKEKAKEEKTFRSFFELGIQQLMLGRFDEGIESLEKARKIDPDDIRSHINIGSAYVRKGSFDDAIKVLEKGIRIKEHPDLYNNLGVAYERQGKIGKAYESFKKSAYIKENLDAYNNIVRLCVQLGKLEDASRVLRRIIEMDPRNTTAMNNLAGISLESGDVDEAIRLLSSSLDINDHPFTHENLAIAFSRKGDIRATIMHFSKAIAGGHPHASKLSQEVKKLRSSL